MQAVRRNDQRIVAVPHDLIEDTHETLQSLREYGFSEEIEKSIDALRKRHGENDYFEFVVRAATNHPPVFLWLFWTSLTDEKLQAKCNDCDDSSHNIAFGR